MAGSKSIYILTSSGKPVYASSGNEDELVNLFGLMQAMISIVQNSNDVLRCITTEDKTIVFLLRNTLYFIVVSSTGEPENVLLRQLDFMYQHILLILTRKVQSVLENNPSTDIRQLLGSDATQILGSSCQGNLAPTCVAFHSIPCAYCEKPLRDDVAQHLKLAVEKSGAAMGLIMSDELLFCAYKNPALELNLATADMVLLTHFVANSKSLRTNDQHWVPLCMPTFNPNGYLNMYISNVALTNGTQDLGQLVLILIAVSGDSDSFSNLLKWKRYVDKAICMPELLPRLPPAIASFRSKADTHRDEFDCLHFLYKFALLLPKGDTQSALGQSVQSSFKIPLGQTAAQQEVWVHYQRLALKLRKGTSEVESTLTSTEDSVSSRDSSQGSKLSSWLLRRDRTSTSSSLPVSSQGAVSSSSGGAADAQANPKDGSSSGGPVCTPATEMAMFDTNLQLLSHLPHVDHSLVYAVTLQANVVVAFATYDSELFVCFPSHINPIEACRRAEALSRTLKAQWPVFSSQIL